MQLVAVISNDNYYVSFTAPLVEVDIAIEKLRSYKPPNADEVMAKQYVRRAILSLTELEIRAIASSVGRIYK
jgi:hypothetical protein